MPTRLPTLTLRAAKPSSDQVAASAAPDPVLGTTTDSPPTPAASHASAIVHKPLSAISRFGSTFFNRKTIVATNKVDPSPAAGRPKRNSTTDVRHLAVRRGSTDGDLLSVSQPAGALTRAMAKPHGSARHLLKPAIAPKAVDVKAPTAAATAATAVTAAAAPRPAQLVAALPTSKEDATRQPVVSLASAKAASFVPHRPDHDNSSNGSTTTHSATLVPRRPPILSKKASANEGMMNGILAGHSALQRAGSSRSITHFDRAKTESFGGTTGETTILTGPPSAIGSQRSSRDDSSRRTSDTATVYTGQFVLDTFSADLTPFEKTEIVAFAKVFYYSSLGVKRRRQNGRVVSPTTDPDENDEKAVDATATAATSDQSRSDHDAQTATKGEVFNDGYDDERGDYVMLMQDHLAYRYEVLHPLGSGSFGQVVCCLDHLTKTKVAVKVIRNRKKYKEQALIEIQVLTQLQETAGSSAHHVVQMADHFVFRNHLCIAFELLGMNLYEYLKLRFFQGMPLANICVVAAQLLAALAHLRTKRIVHCDLKPENVLIQAPLQCFAAGPGYSSVAFANVPVESICLIDFGSSCLDNATIYTYIQSRFYRSPEVILGHPYDTAIDMWSLGCILVELHTGHPIFAGENETEQLMCMMEILGVPATSYLAKCKRRKYFFHEATVLPSTREEGTPLGVTEPTTTTTPSSPLSAATTPNIMTYKPMPFTNSRGRKRIPSVRDLGAVIRSDDADFVALIRKCFAWDPNERLTPESALLEPWILGKDSMKVIVE